MQSLDVLVGRFIHHCGALELMTNNAISQLSLDSILAAEATRAPFARRIATLRCLLIERTDLDEDDVHDLCDSLDEIRKKRNMVAHNPIAAAEPNPDAPETILIVRHKPDGQSDLTEMTRDEVGDLVMQSNALLRRFVELLPSATSDKKHT